MWPSSFFPSLNLSEFKRIPQKLEHSKIYKKNPKKPKRTSLGDTERHPTSLCVGGALKRAVKREQTEQSSSFHVSFYAWLMNQKLATDFDGVTLSEPESDNFSVLEHSRIKK